MNECIPGPAEVERIHTLGVANQKIWSCKALRIASLTSGIEWQLNVVRAKRVRSSAVDTVDCIIARLFQPFLTTGQLRVMGLVHADELERRKRGVQHVSSRHKYYIIRSLASRIIKRVSITLQGS